MNCHPWITMVLILFFLILTPVSAQGLFQNWYEYINIPREYSTFPSLLYFVLIPFLGTFAIIWDILTNLGLFKLPRVNILLSFVFALALLYTGALLAFVGFLFQFGATFGVVAFFVVFIALIGLWGYRRTYAAYGETKKVYEKYEKVGKERSKLVKRMAEIDDLIMKKQGEKTSLERENNTLTAVARDLNSFIRRGERIPDPVWEEIQDRLGRRFGNRTAALSFVERGIGETNEKIRRLKEELEKLNKERLEFSEKYGERL